MSYEVLRLERSGHVAVITLNRPDMMNALSRQLTTEFHAALDEVAGQFPDIRVLILTGEGRAFCSGADLTEMGKSFAATPPGQPRQASPEVDRSLRIQSLAIRLRQMPQPTIAAVNGAAVGAGLSIALASEIRIASEKARFSCIFVRRSLVPDTVSSYTVAALAGQSIANEMALTGRIYDAQWAQQVGLVNKVVPPEKLMDEARAMAEEIASNPPLAVKAIKQLMYAHSPAWEDVIKLEDEAAVPLSGSEDQREAVYAFLENRQPVYKGR